MLEGNELRVVYQDYDTMAIKKVVIPVEQDQYKVLTPKVKVEIVDGEEVRVPYIELKTVDNQISYELVQELSSKEVRELIKVLQQLGKQINNNGNGRC